ncbi:hypothetical protein PG994_008398 [Apiospora phragmitis]|uniref:Uncharacterized protein n=1 Tax=Apiospora phragmitis TaxID=2905665 RepID=A0ABR1UTL2_9PEZI
MVRITFLTTAIVAALSGSTAAYDCINGLDYCGSGLLQKGTVKFSLWSRRYPGLLTDVTICNLGNYYKDIVQALQNATQPTDPDHVNCSIFHCGGPDTVPFQKFCGAGECKDGGLGHNDYCN